MYNFDLDDTELGKHKLMYVSMRSLQTTDCGSLIKYFVFQVKTASNVIKHVSK